MHAKNKKITKHPHPTQTSKTAGSSELPSRVVLVIALVLAAATFAVYAGALGHKFTLWDDNIYVELNPYLQDGLNAKSVAWAFNIGYAANWHPLTWISHALDVQLYGLKPMGHHLTSIFFHVANTLLLFWVLTLLTRAVWKCAFVAALFAFHPLHVESVAWVAERKDVLSTFFGLLAILAYVRYVKRPGIARYVLVGVALCLGLMAKPMLVTLPIVLLLLDYWPLARWRETKWTRLVIEKLPLFAMAVASGIVTIVAQSRGEAVASIKDCPFLVRLSNAVLSYGEYLIKTVWPRNLVIDYAYVWEPPLWQVVAAVVFLVGVTALAIKARSRHPYLMAGWLWYIVTLIPVIGLLQVGDQSMADRYTYIPLIGVFVAASWGISELASRSGLARVTPVLGLTVLVALSGLTLRQVGYWKDSITLFERTLTIAPDNPVIHNDLGIALAAEGRVDEAIEHCNEALRLNPEYAKAHFNLAHCLESRGDVRGAMSEYQKAIEDNSDYFKAHNDLAILYMKMRRFDEAVYHCRQAIEANPEYAAAHGTLSMAYFNMGDYDKAWEEAQLCQSYGYQLPQDYMNALTGRLPGTR